MNQGNVEFRVPGEVVGAMIHDDDGGTITADRTEFAMAWLAGADCTLLTRWEAEFLVHCDLGERWRRLAAGPTWFTVDDEGRCHFPEDGTCR